MSNKVKHLKAKQKYPDKWFVLFLTGYKSVITFKPLQNEGSIYLHCVYICFVEEFIYKPALYYDKSNA